MSVSKTTATHNVARGKSSPASTPGSFTTYAHSAPEIDLAAGDQVEDFTFDDFEAEDPFFAPLDRMQRAGVDALKASLLDLRPGDTLTFPARDGEWRITFDDFEPETTAASGVVDQGQYSALRFDAEGNQGKDFSLNGFDRATKRAEAAHHSADFIIRSERAAEQKAAESAWEAEREAEANSIGARLGASITASLNALRDHVA